jgi:hypothetical protein
LIEEDNGAPSEFVLYSFLELYLRDTTSGNKVIFVATSQNYSHYLAAMKKLGINL